MRKSAGDDEFRGFYERLEPRAVAAAIRLVGSRPAGEDIAAEAFARAYAKWSKVSRHPNPDAWLMRVVGNVAIDHVRHESRRSHFEDFGTGTLAQRSDPSADQVALRIDLTDAISHLSGRQQEVIVLRYLIDLPEDEVAAGMGLSTGSVKTHLHRATTKLRSELGPDAEIDLRSGSGVGQSVAGLPANQSDGSRDEGLTFGEAGRQNG
ncbi:MAG TPA: sigma-70 family RNA polymerase sigma factor [Microthrixaceae bacterium]|nr:sigma-70 family RNA polymerase sigma factor [Microthrixaceae bacterium]